jgi:hypothetical protein
VLTSNRGTSGLGEGEGEGLLVGDGRLDGSPLVGLHVTTREPRLVSSSPPLMPGSK